MLDRGEASNEYQRQAPGGSRRHARAHETIFAASCIISSIAVQLPNCQLSAAPEMLTDGFVSEMAISGASDRLPMVAAGTVARHPTATPSRTPSRGITRFWTAYKVRMIPSARYRKRSGPSSAYTHWPKLSYQETHMTNTLNTPTLLTPMQLVRFLGRLEHLTSRRARQ